MTMVKILSLAIVRTGNDIPEPLICTLANDVSAYGSFQRPEMVRFLTETVIGRTEPGQRQSIPHDGYVVHCYVRSDGLAGTVTTDEGYPSRVAFVLLGQLLEDFTATLGDSWRTCSVPESISFPKIDEYLQNYQDPSSADKITLVRKDLDGATQIWHNKINSVLERDVKLDNLVERSNDLLAQSKVFYKKTKKTKICFLFC